ncbi:hypothetical protein HYC85_017132 [Camellia sinensis]|uniref:chitinase n=1 Tax=Camellia sinensis TaxID=4442 RepID=A0A7J7H4X5_CAMSI|nr:hypothetical protein HYC85_017132 [Camellia sinensis]
MCMILLGGWNPAPGWRFLWEYCRVKEVLPIGDYCDQESETQWLCAPGKQYYGRGPIQLSYNYNYGQITTQSPKPSCHDVIIGNWTSTPDDQATSRVPGYGVITNIINGGLDSGRDPDSRVEDRIGFYKRYCNDEIFDVSTGDNLDCNN